MKKLISALLVLVTVLLCFVGCGSGTNSTNNTPNINNTPNTPNINNSPTTVNVSSVSLSKSELHMTVGDKASISATVSPSNATNKNITWSSTNTAVADYVNGNIVALGEGNCLIKATSNNGIVDSCSVSVTPKQILAESISFDENSYTIFKGGSEVLYLTFSPDKLDDISGSVTSSDNSVANAIYDYGINTSTGKQYIKITIEGKKVGTSTITVTAKGGATCSTNVIVTENMCDKVTVNLQQSLPCNVAQITSYGSVWSRSSITNVDISKEQLDENSVFVTVKITATRTYGDNDTPCRFVICLYKENNIICESKRVYSSNEPVVGEQFTIYYYFEVDVSSGNNREFSIKFINAD